MTRLVQYPLARPGGYAIPDGVTLPFDGMFAGAPNLTWVEVPPSITIIPNDTFNGCTSLTKVTFPPTLVDIGQRSFAGTAVGHITIPADVFCIGAYTFSDCANLRGLIFLGDVPFLDYEDEEEWIGGVAPDYATYFLADRSGFFSPS